MEISMTMSRTVCTMVAVAGFLCAPGFALAQTGSATPPHLKTIGVPSTTKPGKGMELVSSLIVMNSRGATLQGDKLTLVGVTPNSIVFADRPVRVGEFCRFGDTIGTVEELHEGFAVGY